MQSDMIMAQPCYNDPQSSLTNVSKAIYDPPSQMFFHLIFETNHQYPSIHMAGFWHCFTNIHGYNNHPICSMMLEYLATRLGYCLGVNVGKSSMCGALGHGQLVVANMWNVFNAVWDVLLRMTCAEIFGFNLNSYRDMTWFHPCIDTAVEQNNLTPWWTKYHNAKGWDITSMRKMTYPVLLW